MYEQHTGLLVAQERMISTEGCGGLHYYILPKTHPFYKEMLAIIVASHATGQPIKIFVQGCFENYQLVSHIESTRI